MQDEAQTGSGFDRARGIWSRRKWLAILVFAAPFSAGVSLVTSLPNIYRSTATVLVERQQVPEAFVQPTVTSALETRLHTISQEILSRSRLQALISRFGLYRDLQTRVSSEAVIERMREDIGLELKGVQRRARGGTTIAFAISYRGGDPQTVALVTNTLASFYIEENLKVRERQATGTAEFLKTQLEETRNRLDEQERRIGEFKKRYIGELPEQMTANLATLEGLNAQLELASNNMTRALDRRETLLTQLAEADSIGPAGGPEAAPARLARLQQELAALRTQFTDRYPDVVRAKAEIAVLKRRLAEADGGPDTEVAATASASLRRLKEALSALEAEIKVLKRDDKRLRSAITTYQARVENTPRREQEFQELSRDYGTTNEHYRSLLKRYEEAQVAEHMEQRQKGERFRILDPGIPSEKPAAPNRLRLIVFGLLLSLGLAAGAVMLAERLDTSFHSVDDLRAFSSVPVLASVPRIVTEADARRSQRRFRLAAVSAFLSLALLVGASYWLARGNEQLVWMLALGGS